ncbi:MAG: hypothetical protein K2W93_00135, partial [Burkholderiaceae bacterium]|nr:hypothetical protein [Burkholderiaceae bacterium]
NSRLAMKIAILTREPSTDAGTFGTLMLDDGTSLRSVELPWRGNATGRSCIPVGSYRCEIVHSPSKGRVYGVQAVPDRQHILIHVANFAGDIAKGYTSELEGCIAPALGIGELRNKVGQLQPAGISSGKAMAVLMAWANDEPIQLVVR